MEKIRQLIGSSKSFGILLDPKPEEHEILLAEALKKIIYKKNLPVLCSPKLADLPETQTREMTKWENLIQTNDGVKFPQKTALNLPSEENDIQEVAYSKNNGKLSLVITSKTGISSLNEIQIEKLLPEPETIFCFFENNKKLELFRNEMQIPNNENVIFITPDNKTVTEKVFDIIKMFDPDLRENEVCSLLYGALVTETNSFSLRTTGRMLKLGSILTENSMIQDSVSEILRKNKKASHFNLLGRMLARTYVDENTKSSWSFLNQKDIQKTNNPVISSTFLHSLLKKTYSFTQPQNFHVLIWQTVDGARALIASGEYTENERLQSLAENFGIETNNSFFTIGPFRNFSESEIYIRQKLL